MDRLGSDDVYRMFLMRIAEESRAEERLRIAAELDEILNKSTSGTLGMLVSSFSLRLREIE